MSLCGGVTCPPAPENWIAAPLRLIHRIYREDGARPGWEKTLTTYLQERLQESPACWVPSLNDVPLHYVTPGSLVRFRCMIQDMFDPEYYMEVYETVDRNTNSRAVRLGKYRDVADCAPQEEVDVNSGRTVPAERQTFYCVPVPGEAAWAKEISSSSSQARISPSSSCAPSRHKRGYEDDGSSPLQGQYPAENIPKRLEMESQKRPQGPAPTGSAPLDLNFPLPGEKGPACLVKVYDNWDSFKVNDVVEVYGVLSVEPALSAMVEQRDSSWLDPEDSLDTLEEQRVHSPPTSLVPRIHAILTQKLHHINPLIPSSVCKASESRHCLSSFVSELSSVRSELLGFLTHALLGDGLAAEYLVFHLISTVYARRDVLPLGKFSVNLSGCPRSGVFTQQLYRLLQQLVPASHYLSMTIENMNGLRFVPRKDYAANRLQSGLLQLSSHTLLMVDETKLEQGQLDAAGVRHVTALGNLISWQKVDYDFSYHQMEFPCSINVLVTSEGRSLLPSDCQVRLKPQVTPPNMEQYMEALLSAARPSLLNKFRIYLSLLRLMDYSISEEVTKAVEEDFVDMRKDDPQCMSADDLHRLLVVARLLSLSTGHATLSWDRWLRAKQLEELRKSRLREQKHVNGNEL